MNGDRTIRLPGVVGRALGRFRRRWRVVRTLGGLFMALAVVTAGVAAAVVADRLLRLTPGWRMVCLLAIAAAFAALLAARAVWPAIRRIGDRDAAVRLGRSFGPRIEEDLVTAVELTSHESERGISRGLIARALEQISGRAAGVNPRQAVPAKPLLLMAGLFIGLGAALQSSYLLRPEAVGNALARLLMPHRDLPYFCYTRVELTSGEPVIAADDTVELTARISGRVQPNATLQLEITKEVGREGRKEWRTEIIAQQLPVEDGRVAWRSGALFADLRYRVLAGDAVSDWHRVRVVPPPSLSGKAVVLRYPDYTGGQAEKVDPAPGLLAVVEGTTLRIRIRPTNRGPDEQFACTGELLNGGTAVSLTSEDGWLCSEELTPPDGTTEYAIRLTDGFGLRSRGRDSVSIKTVPDLRPRVTIRRPAHDAVLMPGEAIAVEASARDDFGLRELLLHTRVGRSEREVEPVRFDQRWVASQLQAGGPAERELTGEATLAVSSLGLTPGDVLEYKASTSDFADDAFLRTSESEVFRVLVISEMEHLTRALSRLRTIQIELLRLAARQRIEAAGAGQLAEKAASEPIDQQARDAEGRERELARSTDRVAGDVEEILAEMVRNPAASPAVLSDTERLARAVRAVADEPMAQAADQMGEAASNPSQDEQRGAEQARSMTEAEKLGTEAARQLERLAAAVEGLQTRGQMDKLASAAELLAARQRDLKEGTAPVAVKTVGTAAADLPPELKDAIEKLAGEESSIKDGIDELERELRAAAMKLADTDPSAASQAEQASGQMDSEKLSQRAAAIAQAMRENVLFSKLPDQEELARRLAELAKRLRDAPEQDAGERVVREIEKFIERQKQINAGTQAAIAKARDAKTGPALGQEQSALERDVSEQAAAILLLVRELAGFESLTAVQLEAAAEEMRPGANELYLSRLPEGLAHGEKALALLQEARQQAQAEKDMMNQASGQISSMQAALLLQRIINAQKQINEGTAAADEARADADAHSLQTAELTRRQSAVKVDTDRLIELVKPLSDETAEYIGQAGGKMDVSRLALSAGDTGRQTRIVQREIVAMLEPLLKECEQQMGGQGLAGARMKALMQMLALAQQPGGAGGGYAGGSNASLLPSSLGQVGDESWRRARERLDQQLGAGYDAEFPPEYKDLLNAYFDRLRRGR